MNGCFNGGNNSCCGGNNFMIFLLFIMLFSCGGSGCGFNIFEN